MTGVIVVTGGTLAAQAQAPEMTLAARAARLAERVEAARGRSVAPSWVRVVGFVWQQGDRPLAHPSLRIRDLRNGAVVGRTVGTAEGEFRFDQLGGGVYLIELVDAAERVLAVGQPLAVAAGETVGTFLRTEPRLPPPGFGLARGGGSRQFGGVAPLVVEAAQDGGITVFGGGRAASNER